MLENNRKSLVNRPIRQLPPASRFSLRIKDLSATPYLVGDLSLDHSINRFSAVDGRFAARLGPNEWLIIGASLETDNLYADIDGALACSLHALVDVSQASVAFAVEGPDAEKVLNAGCPLDLDVRSFPAGSATRTVFGKCEIILFRLSQLGFRVECWRSFREYVHAFLLEAAALNATAATH